MAYPTNFAGEINCIALTKALATNCHAVTNDNYVLGERNPDAVPNNKFIQAVIDAVKKEPKNGIDSSYIKANSWETVAMDWMVNLLTDEETDGCARCL